LLYKAFISYSHGADGKLAPALQDALHRFAKPWYKMRALRIFRDETNLSVTPELWGSIEKALNESDYFILLASPEASSSRWVQKEVSFWLQNKSAQTLLIVLTEGDIIWNSITNDFDWSLTTALPENLKKTFPEEPLYIDFRKQKEGNQLKLGDPQFLNAVATIAASLHGISMDEIVGEDIRQHRKTKFWIWTSSTILVVLLVATIIGFLTAIEQKDIAIDRQLSTLVEKFHIQAISAIENPGDVNGYPIHAHLLAAQAYKLQPDNPTAHKNLLSTLLSSHSNQYLYGHKKDIKKVTFSSNGKHLASAGDDGLVLWEIHQDKAVEKWRDFSSGAINAVAFSPDNQQIIGGGTNGTLISWRIDSGNKIELTREKENEITPTSITSVAFSADGKLIISSQAGGLLKLWSTNEGKKVKEWRGHNGGKIEAVFRPSHDNQIISYAIYNGDQYDSKLADRHIKLWDLATLKEINKWQVRSEIADEYTHVYFTVSPNGEFFLSTDYYENLLMWNMSKHEKTGQKLIESGRGSINSVALSKDGKQFASSSTSMLRGIFRVWDFDSNKNKIEEKVEWGEARNLNSIAFSPNGKKIVGGGENGALVIWDIFAGDRISEPWSELIDTEADGIYPVSFSNDGKQFATIEEVGSGMKVWEFDNDSRRFVEKWQARSNEIYIQSIALSSDKKTLLAGGNDESAATVEIWNVASDEQNSKPSKTLKILGGSEFMHVAFSKDDKQIYGVTHEGVLVSWDSATFKKKETPLKGIKNNIRRAAFSPDGQKLLTGDGSGGLKLWDMNTGELIRNQPGHEESEISGVAFSSDGKLAVSTSTAATWVLWNVESGDVIGRKSFDIQDLNIGSAYFRPDYKILVYLYGGQDQSAWMLWDVNPVSLASHACEIAGRDFTRDEWERFIGNKFVDYDERACIQSSNAKS
jgi:WD40 repeat protein